MIRLAIVLSHPVQYYAPWFRVLAAHEGLTVRIFYLRDPAEDGYWDDGFARGVQWDVDLARGVDHEFVRAVRWGRFRFHPNLAGPVSAWMPDAVLMFGYTSLSHAFFLARRPRVPLLIRGDSHVLAGEAAGLAGRVKRWLRASAFARCDGALSVGTANAEYFERSGIPRDRIFRVPHCVDNARFAAGDSTENRATIRRRLAVPPSARTLLFVGKLEQKKRPDLLVDVFRSCADLDARLVVVGTGPMQSELERLASGDNRVVFAGFQNQSEIPAMYAAGDILVLPSEGRHETWGLVVNEAMACGRPAIVSSHVGCGPDLIVPGGTGWVFKAGDRAALAGSLRVALDLPGDQLAAMGRAARARVQHYSYDAATDALLGALRVVLARPAG